MSALSGLSHRTRAALYERQVAAGEIAAHVESGLLAAVPDLTSQLRVSAISAAVDYFLDQSVDAVLDRPIEAVVTPPVELESLADLWSAYIRSLDQADVPPTLDDLSTAAGVLAASGRTPEIRALLLRDDSSQLLTRASSRTNWRQFVREEICRAAVLLVRQRGIDDLTQARAAIKNLSLRDAEANDASTAFFLIGAYHLALAIDETAVYLQWGKRTDGTEVVQGFAAQLRRLTIKAESYVSITGDPEASMWVVSISMLLAEVYRASLWTSAFGIDAQIDRLLTGLTEGARDTAIFSLLPSQLEALRKNLLDASATAIVLEMPTSSGKTLLAEFAAVQALRAYRDEGARVVYLCPTRALVTQTARTLTLDLKPLGIDVVVAASAYEEDPLEVELLDGAAGIVVATPEKIDLILRTRPDWFATVRLVVVDEAHLLKETRSERGVRLELLLANLRRDRPAARLLLLTPFVSNADEIARWLGGDRSQAVRVNWRPSGALLGLTRVLRRGRAPSMSIEWRRIGRQSGQVTKLEPLVLGPTGRRLGSSNLDVAIDLMRRFEPLGTVLAVFTASKSHPERAALALAADRPAVQQPSPELRVAIALAGEDYGFDSDLVQCLTRGVAFHHSALSPTLRYLIEDRVRAREIRLVAATTTLAQGMNFPVSTIVIHSLHKPYGGGNLTPSEFWNIAGRAGRVGLSDAGIVLFANGQHQDLLEAYAAVRDAEIRSALLGSLTAALATADLKQAYRENPELRPFLQYLLHAVATLGTHTALARLEELIEGSLASQQTVGPEQATLLRSLALRYVRSVSTNQGMNRTADASGLGSFSFSELFAKSRANQVLADGPDRVLEEQERGLFHLIEALRWLPELDLAIGYGEGQMNVQRVAATVQAWMDGKTVREISSTFPGDTPQDRVRRAGTYVYDKVSQTVSWGAHAYVQGWQFGRQTVETPSLLPSFIEFGVKTEEGVAASLFGVPRAVAEAVGAEYVDAAGGASSPTAEGMKRFLAASGAEMWRAAVSRAQIRDLDGADLRYVWRGLRGLENG